MKKLFLFSVAALAFCACSSDEVVSENSAANQQPKEISFAPLNKVNTRAAVQGTTFPEANTMEVRAYQSSATAGEYFAKTTFARKEISTGVYKWGGNTPQYWPLIPATINFFAVSAAGVNAGDITIADALASATVEYDATASNNASNTAYFATTQSDIMYAFNRGSVTKSGNTLTFPNEVGMVFNHALALINFQIKAGNDASTAIEIYKIELNGARYTGDLTITNTNAATLNDTWSAKVDWSPNDVVNKVQVPNIGNTTTPVGLTTSYVPTNSNTETASDWASLMIIPTQQKTDSPISYGFTTFTIYYRLNGHDYTYTYAPTLSGSDPALTAVQAGYKYTYQITMTLHEILINPSVTAWTEQNSNVAIPQ